MKLVELTIILAPTLATTFAIPNRSLRLGINCRNWYCPPRPATYSQPGIPARLRRLTETSYLLARAWSVADFEHGPIALVEAGFPVLLVGAAGPVEKDLEGIATRLAEYGCRVIGIFDSSAGSLPRAQTMVIDSGLPEELSPLPLAVLGQLLAHRVALARGVDPDRPQALHKVTRTW